MAIIARSKLSLLIFLFALNSLLACAPVTPITATTAAVSGDPRTTGTVVEDERIESKAADFFNADAQISQACHLNVASYNRWVLITGECPTEKLRTDAETFASRVAKVERVFNEIVLTTPSTLNSRSADALTTTKVKTKLFTIKSLPSRNMKVITEAGVVFLMGIVDSASGDSAASVAASVSGVNKVVKLFELP